jgi:hypothetical protein
LVEYIKMLTLAREMRYISLRTFQNLATHPISEVDSRLTELSRTYYMIALIAPGDTRRIASDLRESIFMLWRKARDHPESDQYPADLAKVRELAETFSAHVTAQLNLTNVTSERNRLNSRKQDRLSSPSDS